MYPRKEDVVSRQQDFAAYTRTPHDTDPYITHFPQPTCCKPKRRAKCKQQTIHSPSATFIPVIQHGRFTSTLKPPPHPHPPKQQHEGDEERNPGFPPDTRLLGHAKHPIHGASDLVPTVLELVVHFLGEGGGVTDFVADEVCQLLVLALAQQ